MSSIKFYNIYNQDRNIHKNIIKKISNTIKKNKFILSNDVKNFEKKFSNFCRSKFAVGVGNGTDAIYLAIKALNLKKDDEIILPAMTWKSTLTSVINNNLKPVLVDINDKNSNINLDDLKKKISKKTKAIIVVHLYGNPGEIYKIKKIIKGKNIKIIEDAAQAHGARESFTNKIVGSIGDLGCFSFYPGKNLGAYGDAGGITTNSKKFYKRVLELRNIGAFKSSNKSDCRLSGINSRLDNIQAIILNEKLKKLNYLNKKRKSISRRYEKELNNFKISKLEYEPGAVYHQYVIKTNNRNKFLNYLAKRKIEYGIHYPISINNLKIIKKENKKKFPNAEKLARQCVSIPIDPLLKKEQITKIINVINSY